MDAATAWSRLTSLATLGTARHGGDLPEAPHPSLALPAGPRETTFLRTAAATLTWTLAGERAAAGTPIEPTPPPPERHVSEAAARRLARMLGGEGRTFVPEWLELTTRAGAVLPPAWVPPIFEALDAESQRRHARVFGATLGRLAALDARWSVIDATAMPADEAWTAGTVDERLGALQALRALDPPRARRWIESTWETDPPEVRERAIAALAVGLAPADEQLLERALDDRRKSVRQAGAEALGRLRDSAYVQRACARLEPHLAMPARGTGLLARFARRRLEIELPTALDKPAQRDGLEPKPPTVRKLGERAWWLAQMVAAVPPDVHVTRFECTPDEFVAAALETDHARELVEALVRATARFDASAWVAPLTEAVRARAIDDAQTHAALATLVGLTETLDRAKRAAPLRVQVRALVDHEQVELAVALLTAVDAEWDEELTRLALRALEAHVQRDARSYPQPTKALDAWAARADAGMAAPLVAALASQVAPETSWQAAVQWLHDQVQFRIDMRKELVP